MPGAGAPGPPSIPSTPGRAVDADPDVDGVALAAATATGVLLGSRFAAVAAGGRDLLPGGGVPVGGRRSPHPGRPRAGRWSGCSCSACCWRPAAASVRAAAVRGGLLVGWLRQPARVGAAVAEEPRRLRHGGHWVVLTVDRVDRGGRTYRTRERAGLIVPRGEDGRFAVGTGCACGPRSGRPGGAMRWGGSRRWCSGIP